jgi:hypothetical protein
MRWLGSRESRLEPTRTEGTQMDQKQLRALVARMQDEVTLASPKAAKGDDVAPPTDLSRAWDALLKHLAVELAPDVRACPYCNREIMRAATLCGYCWKRSSGASADA